MTITREEIKKAMEEWNLAWDNHDLEGVMQLFHDEVVFENWTGGKAVGKEALRKAWAPWFADHGGFRFQEEDLFYRRKGTKGPLPLGAFWPSHEKGYEGKPENAGAWM